MELSKLCSMLYIIGIFYKNYKVPIGTYVAHIICMIYYKLKSSYRDKASCRVHVNKWFVFVFVSW